MDDVNNAQPFVMLPSKLFVKAFRGPAVTAFKEVLMQTIIASRVFPRVGVSVFAMGVCFYFRYLFKRGLEDEAIIIS